MKFLLSWLAIHAEVFLLVNFVAASPLLAVQNVDILKDPKLETEELAPLHDLLKRNATTTLGTFSLATQHTNSVLFSM